MAPLPEFSPAAGQVEPRGDHYRARQQEDQTVEKGEDLEGLEGLLGGRPPPQVDQADRLGVNRPGKVSARLLEQGETPDVLNGLADGAAAADAHYTQRMSRRYVR